MTKKRNHKESMICLKPKPTQNFFVNSIFKQQKKGFMRKKVNGGLNKKTERSLFSCSLFGDKEQHRNVNKKVR